MGRSIVIAAIALQLAATPAFGAAGADAIPAPAAGEHAGRPAYRNGGWYCPPGFVWRNAGPQDWLCVDPFEAQKIARENQQAPKNWIDTPDGARECRSGLVRREAFNSDPVCVDPIRRAMVHEMNLALFDIR